MRTSARTLAIANVTACRSSRIATAANAADTPKAQGLPRTASARTAEKAAHTAVAMSSALMLKRGMSMVRIVAQPAAEGNCAVSPWVFAASAETLDYFRKKSFLARDRPSASSSTSAGVL